jgi:hypothetical protein
MSSTPSRADQHTGNTETNTTRDASVLIGKDPRLDSLLGRSLSTQYGMMLNAYPSAHLADSRGRARPTMDSSLTR